MTLIGRTFLHASDLHIGSPLGKLERCSTLEASELHEVTTLMQQSFTNLVDLALRENVLFVVLSGDVYDGAEAQDSQQGLFHRGLERLAEADIPVYIALGNHDPKREGFAPRKPYPPSVRFFDVEEPHEFVVASEGDLTIKVAGVSYGSNAVHDNLAERFSRFADEPGTLRVGVLHTSLSGNSDHEPYAPCSVEDLSRAPVHYWALGHIHLRSVQRLGNDRWYAYPGNLQGRSFKPAECHPKGALIVPIDRHAFGVPQFHECDTVRFVDLAVDISECERLDETHASVADAIIGASNGANGRRIVARVSLVGRSQLHRETARSVASGEYLVRFLDSFRGDIADAIVAGVTCDTKPDIDPATVRKGDSLLANALRRLDSMTDDDVVDQMEALTHLQFQTNLDTSSEGVREFRRLVEASLLETMEP